MKYRSRNDIISKVLQAAHGGATKTRIMYAAFLSFAQVQEYLPLLVSNGLLVHDPSTGFYTETETSRRFMHAYNEMREMCELNPDAVSAARDESPIEHAPSMTKAKKAELDSRPRVFA